MLTSRECEEKTKEDVSVLEKELKINNNNPDKSTLGVIADPARRCILRLFQRATQQYEKLDKGIIQLPPQEQMDLAKKFLLLATEEYNAKYWYEHLFVLDIRNTPWLIPPSVILAGFTLAVTSYLMGDNKRALAFVSLGAMNEYIRQKKWIKFKIESTATTKFEFNNRMQTFSSSYDQSVTDRFLTLPIKYYSKELQKLAKALNKTDNIEDTPLYMLLGITHNILALDEKIIQSLESEAKESHCDPTESANTKSPKPNI